MQVKQWWDFLRENKNSLKVALLRTFVLMVAKDILTDPFMLKPESFLRLEFVNAN